MTTLSRYGISATLRTGWEGRIYNRGDQSPPSTASTAPLGAAGGTDALSGPSAGAGPVAGAGRTNPILHLANFALPTVVGDYGGAAVETMANDHLFVAFVEFSPDSAGTALFRSTGMPKLRADDFDPNCLQHVLKGQSGTQKFFTVNGRPFCLYVVLGSHTRRVRTVPVVNDVTSAIAVN